jgi:hypothetical protein
MSKRNRPPLDVRDASRLADLVLSNKLDEARIEARRIASKYEAKLVKK